MDNSEHQKNCICAWCEVDRQNAEMRAVRRWWDTDYPIIARLNHNTFDLVAHPNGPALCDGDMMASIDTHPDDSRELMKLKMQAQAAWREYAWPLVKENFYPSNAASLPPETSERSEP